MPRACRPESLRPSDVIRVSAKSGQSGRRVVVVSREVFDASVKVLYRGLVKGPSWEHISDTSEGFTSLSNRTLHPVEGVWEGELTPGAPGRTMEYNNRAYQAPKLKGEAKVPTAKKKAPARGRAAAKKAAPRADRATEAQLDKQSAQVVKMRDTQNKAWGDIADALDIAPSRLRALYNRGGGAPTATRGKGATAKKSTGGKTAAKGKTAARGRGKRSPS